jgi:hypothetical protein
MLPDWLQAGILSVCGAALVLGIWQGTKLVTRRRTTQSAEAGQGDRIAIYVADLHGDDATHSVRARLIDLIIFELGIDIVQVLAIDTKLMVIEENTDHMVEASYAEARRQLRKMNGDLLIGGRVHAFAREKVLKLRFLTAATAGHTVCFPGALHLEEKFTPELGTALAALIALLALPAVSPRGTAVWKRLMLLARRLERLTRRADRILQPHDRRFIMHCYALTLDVIGEWSGDSTRLQEAVAAYRAALTEVARDLTPHDWAAMQNNLGTALATLGARGNRTACLEEAVAAFDAALTVFGVSSTEFNADLCRYNRDKAFTLLAQRRGQIRTQLLPGE